MWYVRAEIENTTIEYYEKRSHTRNMINFDF